MRPIAQPRRAWPVLLLLLAPPLPLAGGARAQAPAPGDRAKVVLRGPDDCTCAPCGCDPNGSCEGSGGCAPKGLYGGGAKAPADRAPRGARFDGKTVLITGGSSGIGFAAAEAFVRECAAVFFSGRDAARGAAAQAHLRALAPAGCGAAAAGGAGARATFVPADVRNATATREFVRAAGDFQIALLNAGVGGYGVRRLVDVDDSFFSPGFEHDPLEINVRGLIISMREVLRHWEARCRDGGGNKCARAMVVTGSISGQVPSPRFAIYAASKAAVNSLCRSVAAEYRPPVEGVFGGDGALSVRVNCVSPGPTNTKLFRDIAKGNGDYGNLYPFQCWQQAPGGGGALSVVNGGVGGAGQCPSIKLGEPINVQAFVGGQKGVNTRIADAAEQAAVILNLASDDASSINGAVVTSDGGYTTV
ncbi:hypothetical protein Rsub_08338 [Raphidocelis subcapitata]|uniref:Uncharacterized protein n=1 Tax=Raphidocelis subcapitata TaxID=307507 RepID=A0A2V0PDQ7_9CHLO|nr:hypothetical protein Rsub_08338 [Raphidocelis subcapitata]|eukprot:GBF95307.1 hypothetical protein Rsub_08338 [Raphidocelis subcapitata]